MEEGVKQVNYFKAVVLMISKNLVTTGTAQVATQQSLVTAGTAQGTTCEIVWCSSGAVCGSRRVGLKPSTVGETARGPLAASTASQAGLTAGLSVAKGGLQNARRAHPDAVDWQPHRDGIEKGRPPETSSVQQNKQEEKARFAEAHR